MEQSPKDAPTSAEQTQRLGQLTTLSQFLNADEFAAIDAHIRLEAHLVAVSKSGKDLERETQEAAKVTSLDPAAAELAIVSRHFGESLACLQDSANWKLVTTRFEPNDMAVFGSRKET